MHLLQRTCGEEGGPQQAGIQPLPEILHRLHVVIIRRALRPLTILQLLPIPSTILPPTILRQF